MQYTIKSVTENEEQSVVIDGYTNTWSAFEKLETNEGVYYIYENDKWGDMTNYLVCLVADETILEVYETYDDIVTCLEDEDIL